jgi:flagellar biosynthesis/type III secretory pathway protein FliH
VNISHWLRKAPQPVAIMADAQRIEVPKNARAWRDLTATIEAIEPSKLTALDAAGNVIRSIVLESDDGKEPTRSEMASDLQLFARLLAEGYEKGQKANQPIIDSAMAMLERHGSRLARAEAECDRLRAVIHRQQLQLAGQAAAPADGGDDSLLSKIMAGALQAGALGAVGGNGANVSAIKPGLKK